jgi:hypothetical protein
MAENVYSEQFGPDLTAEGLVEPILYYGDNLEILRRYIEDESVDLVHLDPPFKSDQAYNILFAERNGAISPFNLHSEIRNLKYSPTCGRGLLGGFFLSQTQRQTEIPPRVRLSPSDFSLSFNKNTGTMACIVE